MGHSHNHSAEAIDLVCDESRSLFLTSNSRNWSKNLSLKVALFSAFLLTIAFICSFFESFHYASLTLQVFVFFLSGTPAIIDALEDILDLEINIDVLMTLAAFLSVLIGNSMEGALLLVLFALSGAMEHSVLGKAQGALRTLHELSPTKANVIEHGKVFERSIKDINVGTLIFVKSGELVPLDGKIIEGRSLLDLAHLTGEHLPVSKGIGEEIPAGARNLEGALTIEVSKTGADSTLSRIIHLITQAQENKPQLQQWFDKFSRWYAMSIIGITLLLIVILPLLTSILMWGDNGSLDRALSFLIAASPCALIIAVPITYLSALSSAARRGILIKGSHVIEALGRCKTIAFDKTGTLTTGKLLIESIKGTIPEQEALIIAAALEHHAMHPIAKAICLHVEHMEIKNLPELQNFKAFPGDGIEGYIEETLCRIGRPEFVLPFLEINVAEEVRALCQQIQNNEMPLTVLAVGNKFVIFSFTDMLRPNLKETMNLLRKENKQLVMLTGDHMMSAKKVANQVGLSEFYADLRPEDKLVRVEEYALTGGLAMVGDGVNDAPALARATVGIAMGQVGSSTSIDIAEVVLLKDDLSLLPWLLKKARKTQWIMMENVIFASGIICCISTLAVFGFIPLWLAVILHEGGTVLVGLNALRLLRQ